MPFTRADLDSEIKCPYCGRTGRLVMISHDGSAHVIHLWGWISIRNVIPCEVEYDGCRNGKRTGYQNDPPSDREFVFIEKPAAWKPQK